MLDTHAVARSLTAADFTPAQADALTDALRLVVEQGAHDRRRGPSAPRPARSARPCPRPSRPSVTASAPRQADPAWSRDRTLVRR